MQRSVHWSERVGAQRGVGWAVGAVLAGVTAGCGGERASGGVVEFQTARIVPASGPVLELDASSSRRFGFGGPVGSPATSAPVSDVPVASSTAGLDYDLPAGWSTLEPTSMRTVNLSPEPGVEVYLTLLGGDGGGLGANVDRWRSQLGLGPLGPEALASLPREPFIDGPAVRFDERGTFGGMGGGRSEADFRVVGLLRVTEGGSAFLKFVGPSAAVERHMAAFDALARSFRPEGGGAGAEPVEAPAVAGDDAALTWDAPVGWTRGADRMMREVTYQVGAVECYVAILPGDAGGVRANLDRWRGQLGAPALSELEFEELATLSMLGVTARAIDVEGDFTGMRGEAMSDARLLGAIAFLGSRTVFVKLIGPRDEVEAQREAFVDFCRSLEVRG